MSPDQILVVVLCQLIAICHGSNVGKLADRYDFTKRVQGKILLSSAVTEHVRSRSFLHCCALCHASESCRGVAYSDTDCWFVTKTVCSDMFSGACDTCSYRVMMYTFATDFDCKSLLEHGHTDDGVYTISPDGNAPFQVFCDMTNGGWTVIQRRVDDSVDFYRGWADYVTGFGDLSGNFWAGLDNIHALNKLAENLELLVTMSTFEGESAEARYSSFGVDNAESGYKLSVGGYSGSAGDSMAHHNGRKFSTYDKDLDDYGGNCAQIYSGAWWYGACHHSNPNGLYQHGTTGQYAKGVHWHTFKGHGYSLKTIELKVRRIS